MKRNFDEERRKFGLDESWKVQLREFFENTNPDTYRICKGIVIHLLDRVFAKIDEKAEKMENLQKRRDELISKKR